MLKTKACFRVDLDGKTYELYCDADSPCGNMHDALMQMKKWVIDRMLANQMQEEAVSKQRQEQPCSSEGEDECQPEPTLTQSEA